MRAAAKEFDQRGSRILAGLRLRQEGPGLFQLAAGLGGGVEPGVADLMEAAGEDVLDEAAEELDGVEGGGLMAFGAEGDMGGAHIQQP